MDDETTSAPLPSPTGDPISDPISDPVTIEDMEDALSLPEAADLLGISYSRARAHAAAGRLRAVKPGGQYYVPRRFLDDFVASGEVALDARSRRNATHHREMVALVAMARRSGASWRELGSVLGVTGEAVRSRFKEDVDVLIKEER